MPHHIAERYGLLVIITLGEGIIGTVAALSTRSSTTPRAGTLDAVARCGRRRRPDLRDVVDVLRDPVGELLHAHRERSFGWGYGHIRVRRARRDRAPACTSPAYYLEHHTKLGTLGTVLSVAIPLAIYIAVALRDLHGARAPRRSVPPVAAGRHGGVLVLAVVLAASGMWMAVCLVVLMLAPLVTVVGYETLGHRHLEAILKREGTAD